MNSEPNQLATAEQQKEYNTFPVFKKFVEATSSLQQSTQYTKALFLQDRLILKVPFQISKH